MANLQAIRTQERNAARNDFTNKKDAQLSGNDKSHDENQEEDSQYTSFPLPTNLSERTDSTVSDRSFDESHHIDVKYAQYTEAPAMYTEAQYVGKTDDEQSHMRMTDYAKEISRMMGHQIVRGLKDNENRENAELLAKSESK